MHRHENQQQILSSGLTVEVDATLQSIFGLKKCSIVLHVRSTNSAQLFGPLPSCISHITCCPERVVWISVRKSGRVEVAMMFRSTLANSQRWSNIFPIVDELFSSFRVCEFKVRSRRSLAALLSDGPSHVGKSNQFVLTVRRREVHNHFYDYWVHLQSSLAHKFEIYIFIFCVWRFIVV